MFRIKFTVYVQNTASLLCLQHRDLLLKRLFTVDQLIDCKTTQFKELYNYNYLSLFETIFLLSVFWYIIITLVYNNIGFIYFRTFRECCCYGNNTLWFSSCKGIILYYTLRFLVFFIYLHSFLREPWRASDFFFAFSSLNCSYFVLIDTLLEIKKLF